MRNQILTILSILLISVLMLNFTHQKTELYQETPLFITDIKVVNEKGIFLSQKGVKTVALYNEDFSEKKKEWKFAETPTGLAVSGKYLFVTCFEISGSLSIIDLDSNIITDAISTGSGTTAPIVSQDGKKVFVCNQFSNTISEIDLVKKKETRTVKVLREPRVVISSKDGKFLYVANYLPAQRADIDTVAACISVIRMSDFKKIKDIQLTNGSNAVQGLCLSPDHKYLFATHNLGRFQVPTSQLQQGWMNTSAMSVINTQTLENEGAVLIDEPERGAGGLWSIACTDKNILITQFGTHEMSVIDYPAFLEKYTQQADKSKLSYDLHFLYGIRERIHLYGNGPHEFSISNNKVYIPSYFSDTINVLDLNTKLVEPIALVRNRVETDAQKGEKYFNDASYCYQNWQSCSGCHPGEARTDGLNWDLMNDGMGNPKNCKSMILAHETPPCMVSGIRAKAEIAVRRGFLMIQFYDIPEEKAQCVDAYLKSLKPIASPYLVHGKLSEKALEGHEVFDRMSCSHCHSGPYYTDLQFHRIGENVEFKDGWDTPTLKEVWRTSPYLFDGRAVNLQEVFGKYKHGIRDKITPKEIEALAEYVNSL